MLGAVVSLLLTIAPAGPARTADAACEKDVAFALPELEKRCRDLLNEKGIDWKRVSKEITAAAKRAKDGSEHLRVLMQLVARLRDGHAEVRPTEQGKAIPPPADLSEERGGLGIFLCTIDGKLYVKNAFGEAKQAGVEPGSRLVAVDGRPAEKWLTSRVAELRDVIGFSTDTQALFFACHQGLAFPRGTRVVLELVAPSGKPVKRTITCGRTRQVPWGPLAIPEKVEGDDDVHWWKSAGGFGVIHLRRCPGDLPERVERALAALGPVPGLILDFRGNSGGGFDHDALMGRFVPDGKTLRFGKSYASAGKTQYAGPVVVIVNGLVRSAGETGSGIFKEDGRAYMIGESATAGMSSSKETLDLPSGLFQLYFSVASNKGRFNGGKGIEGIGVQPHELVSYTPKDLAAGVDTILARAEAVLAAFPNDPAYARAKVPYDPKAYGWK
jgi:carboxyl-terminal processing protease